MKFFLLLFFTSFTYGISIDNHLSGGNDVNPHQFPFAVVVFSTPSGTTRQRICGGALISRQAILSAALCAHNHINVRVGLGVHDITNSNEPFAVWMEILQENVRAHPDYPADTSSDISILRLTNAIGFFNQAVQIIALPTSDNEFLNTAGNAIGWGCTNPLPTAATCSPVMILRSIALTTQAASNCGAHPFNQMCAGGGIFGGTTCSGDEGGPLFASIGGNFVLMGIAYNFPGLCQGSTMTFTRITSFLPWIRENM